MHTYTMGESFQPSTIGSEMIGEGLTFADSPSEFVGYEKQSMIFESGDLELLLRVTKSNDDPDKREISESNQGKECGRIGSMLFEFGDLELLLRATKSNDDPNEQEIGDSKQGKKFERNGCKQEGVFSDNEVRSQQGPLTFFIAGRGGETNSHPGNQIIRKAILSHREEYLHLNPRARGKNFGRRVLGSEAFRDVRFVVGISYFLRNQANKKISSSRLFSVVSEHGADKLDQLKDSDYVTVGAEWAQGIIVDLLRSPSKPAATSKRSDADEFSTNPSPMKKRAIQVEDPACTQPERTYTQPNEKSPPHSGVINPISLAEDPGSREEPAYTQPEWTYAQSARKYTMPNGKPTFSSEELANITPRQRPALQRDELPIVLSEASISSLSHCMRGEKSWLESLSITFSSIDSTEELDIFHSWRG